MGYSNLKSLREVPYSGFFGGLGGQKGKTQVDEFYVIIESDGQKLRPSRKEGHSYYPVEHKATYKVRLGNDSSRRADVDLFIDSEKMGTWRVPARGSILVERPVKSARLFTFLRERSTAALLSGIRSSDPNNGLIRAVFRKEKKCEDEKAWESFDCFEGDLACLDHPKYSCEQGFSTQELRLNSNQQILTQNTNSLASCSSFRRNSRVPQSTSQSMDSFASGATVLGDRSRQEFYAASPITEHESPVTVNVRLVTWKPSQDRVKSNDVPPPISPCSSRPFPHSSTFSPLSATSRPYCPRPAFWDRFSASATTL